MPFKKVKSGTPQALLFDMPMSGEIISPKDNEPFYPIYKKKDDVLFEGDSIEWLKSIESKTVDLVFADPPYNIKKADWDKFESQKQYIQWSIKWIKEASRVLKNTGTL